jgi:hypothetical protein
MKVPRLFYPEGTRLIALDHWTGHMSHPRGTKLVAGPGGMRESADYPGHVEGLYRYLCGDHWLGGTTIGLKVAQPSEDRS